MNTYTPIQMSTKQTIKAIVSEMLETHGKCSLPNLGTELKKAAITPQLLGVKMFSEFFEQDPDFILDRRKVYVNLATTNTHSTPISSSPVTSSPASSSPASSSQASPHLPLCLQHYSVDWDGLLNHLALLLGAEEEWTIASLKNYIKTQYSASRDEGKILYNESLTAFHLGLYTSDGGPCYAYIETANGSRVFKKILSSTWDISQLSCKLGSLPKRPSYGAAKEKYFDLEAFSLDCINYDHLLSRFDRLPPDFQIQNMPRGCQFRVPSSAAEEIAYRQDFISALNDDKATHDAIVDRLRGSVRRALIRVEETPGDMALGYNYRHANLEHLLPLDINGDGTADCALVIVKQEGSYYAPTIITLKMAKCSARSIGKITCGWLM